MPRNASAITSLPTGWEAEDYPQEDLKLISRTLDVVGDAWSLLIIREALAGTSRFGQFQRSLGLAPNILAARLRALVEHGVLETHASAQRADWSDYVLTEKGRGCILCWPLYGNGGRSLHGARLGCGRGARTITDAAGPECIAAPSDGRCRRDERAPDARV
ncbi:winged helix-turn-helix transcriptional regulator [Cupriavidus campinensis]|uniref:winged helix-turn-helix transcriptional regulator n=1 Tax=Cupriavidus campinensis TaxID=151783 RepID=UPI0021CC5D0A|nr:helix-turn-helix domain-containing protein [Cupriavidus campinensis]